jgi:hypothetical protein
MQLNDAVVLEKASEVRKAAKPSVFGAMANPRPGPAKISTIASLHTHYHLHATTRTKHPS